MEKVITAFSKVNGFARAIIKYGTQASLALLLLGTILFIMNRAGADYSSYSEFISLSIIKTSFVILAEAIIGGLLIDFMFKK